MKILFAGEGGQGVQVIAQILAKAAFLEGKSSLYIPNFGVEQRGGVSVAFLIIQKEPIYYPKFVKADVLAILAERSIPRVQGFLDKKTIVILGPAVKKGLRTKLPSKVWNILVLGKVNQKASLVRQESLIQAVNERFEKQFQKDSLLKKYDLEALNS